ncbi:MAG: SigB/SigF/SigG family RNA polymerase sigma factor [Thermoleophilaceae bacterium]|nr:SigB/SigF/SigG family RNA polymerase sigma factor [Thermoleophilaceae bacterium]
MEERAPAKLDTRSREDVRLLRAYHKDGDVGAREQVIERFLPLAETLARRYARKGEPLDDLTQVASLGLVKAVDRFDPDRGTSFSSYAVPTIVGELKRHFRDVGWTVRVPRGMQERALKVDRVVVELSGKLGRSPTPAEVAERIGDTVEDVLEAMEAAVAYDAVSLEAGRSGDPDNEGDSLGDTVGAEDRRYDLVEYEASIAAPLKALEQREQMILHLRFVEDMTQSEIAERIGISQMHVSRLIRRSLATLREGAGEQ